MLNYLYNNNYEFVQTADALVIRAEMNNYARVVRIGGQHPPAAVRTLHGDSVGRWDGETLVIETTHFHPLHASGMRAAHRARQSDRTAHPRFAQRNSLRVHGGRSEPSMRVRGAAK